MDKTVGALVRASMKTFATFAAHSSQQSTRKSPLVTSIKRIPSRLANALVIFVLPVPAGPDARC